MKSKSPRHWILIQAKGESALWLTGGALTCCLLMVVFFLGLILYQGTKTFWPKPVTVMTLNNGQAFMGEVEKAEQKTLENGQAGGDFVLLRTGNFEITHEHFNWVDQGQVQNQAFAPWALVLERRSWGRFYGTPQAFFNNGELICEGESAVWNAFQAHHPDINRLVAQVQDLEVHGLGHLNKLQERARLEVKQVELDYGRQSPEHVAEQERFAALKAELEKEFDQQKQEIDHIKQDMERFQIELTTASGKTTQINLSDIVRAYPANQLSFIDKLLLYGSRWVEFLTAEPREANSEGGILPALLGTLVMTLVMTLFVVPLGVMAAVYMYEYARQGLLISVIRIAVNNLAGVPSIVFGVFGLGFFCYLVGGTLDEMFFAASLPNPTFGKGGLLWSSLTLALLTLPVVIVATEESLATVPNSMREGSYACGAGRWETIRRIVLPKALPGIMTGVILAIARGAGEVAPLMLVGAVKLAPELPLDAIFPYLHGDRSFMHLGFHIYDLGFQSQNSDAARPMVYTATLLLIVMILALNAVALWLRARFKKRFHSTHF